MPGVRPVGSSQSAHRPAAACSQKISAKTNSSLQFKALVAKPKNGATEALGPVAPRGLVPTSQTAANAARQHDAGPSRRGFGQAEEPDGETLAGQTVDPLCCQLAPHFPILPEFSSAQSAPSQLAALPLREDLQNMLTGMARKVAWGGDRRKGTARIELSEGAFAGATLIVHTDQRSVEVELELPSGMGAQGFQERIADRLRARGFSARVRVA